MNIIYSRPRIVYCLGQQAEDAAKLFARLTDTPYKICNHDRDIGELCDAIVICTPEQLTARLMHKLYVSTAKDGVPGLVCAETTAELQSICHRMADKVGKPQCPMSKPIFVNHSFASIEEIDRGSDLLIGGAQPLDKLVLALACGASVLSIFGDSDGIDFRLTSRHFLCPYIDSKLTSRDLLPPCQSLGQCTRFPVLPTIGKAAESRWIIPLTVLRAAIGIMLGCGVVRVNDSVIDPAYGLGLALLQQADFGVVVTTWRAVRTSPNILNGLVDDLCAGMMVGRAVYRFNNSILAKSLGMNLCVLGDPCFALLPTSMRLPLPPPLLEPPEICFNFETSNHTCHPEVALVRDATLYMMQKGSFVDIAKGNSLVAAIDQDHTSMSVNVNLDDSVAIAHNDAALLDFLGAEPWLFNVLAPFAELDSLTDESTCPFCHAPARTTLMTFPKHRASIRRVINCACCGDCSILPLEWQVSFDLDRFNDKVVYISGVPPGACVLVCFVGDVGIPWMPNTGFGLPQFLHRTYLPPSLRNNYIEFLVPDDIPTGPLNCIILIARHFELGSISFKLRKLPNHIISTARDMKIPNRDSQQ